MSALSDVESSTYGHYFVTEAIEMLLLSSSLASPDMFIADCVADFVSSRDTIVAESLYLG